MNVYDGLAITIAAIAIAINVAAWRKLDNIARALPKRRGPRVSTERRVRDQGAGEL